MKIGITFTARSGAKPLVGPNGRAAEADDAEEEFDSPQTIEAIAAALGKLGHEVELLGDGLPLIKRLIDSDRLELVFNLAEGRGISRSREAWVPALLESLGIAHTGSDPLTLATTLDKDCAKRLVAAAGMPVPAGVLVDDLSDADGLTRKLNALELPLIVKPAFEGSSKGIIGNGLVTDRGQLFDEISKRHGTYRQPVLVEEFIDGEELTVGILGNAPPEVLGIMRVVPLEADGPFIYSLDVKRDWRRRVRYEVPAQLNSADDDGVCQAALAAFQALGCRDVARIDFRLRRGVPYFLEANPLPGLTPGAGDLVLLAAGMGVEYDELIGRIVAAALGRLNFARRRATTLVAGG